MVSIHELNCNKQTKDRDDDHDDDDSIHPINEARYCLGGRSTIHHASVASFPSISVPIIN